MFLLYFASVAPEMVPNKGYFLEGFDKMPIIYGLRGLFIVASIVALIIYFKMKNTKGE